MNAVLAWMTIHPAHIAQQTWGHSPNAVLMLKQHWVNVPVFACISTHKMFNQC